MSILYSAVRKFRPIFYAVITLAIIPFQIFGEMSTMTQPPPPTTRISHETITLGGGCFWCIEAVMSELKGVDSAVSGYSGGRIEAPTYEQICTGKTGHAEVVQVSFNPAVISVGDLLSVFFSIHNPTTQNRQGNDVGTQYRSVVFYRNDKQRNVAKSLIAELTEKKIWPDPIITQVAPYYAFYRAEDYHQKYFSKNPHNAYCAAIINPKLSHFRAQFLDKIK